jgi:lipoate-protein ligase B
MEYRAALITSHGFSVNVNPNLAYFDRIMPDGIENCNITSLHQILKAPIGTETAIESIMHSFCEVFGIKSSVNLPEMIS